MLMRRQEACEVTCWVVSLCDTLSALWLFLFFSVYGLDSARKTTKRQDTFHSILFLCQILYEQTWERCRLQKTWLQSVPEKDVSGISVSRDSPEASVSEGQLVSPAVMCCPAQGHLQFRGMMNLTI